MGHFPHGDRSASIGEVPADRSQGLHRATILRIARTWLLRTMSQRVSPGPVTPDASVSAHSSIDGLALVELMDPTIVSLDWRWMPLR